MSALPTDENAHDRRRSTAPVLLIMHSVGLPKQRHTDVQYADILRTLECFFDRRRFGRRSLPESRSEAIVLDPGIDFAKQKSDNLRIYRESETAHAI